MLPFIIIIYKLALRELAGVISFYWLKLVTMILLKDVNRYQMNCSASLLSAYCKQIVKEYKN